jgi:hypothetical protein
MNQSVVRGFVDELQKVGFLQALAPFAIGAARALAPNVAMSVGSAALSKLKAPKPLQPTMPTPKPGADMGGPIMPVYRQ